MRKQTFIVFLLFLIPFLVLYLFTFNNALLWDTVQFAGRHPTFYYDTNFKQFLLPDFMDSGHPPSFGIYLAFLWTLFGKSLWISHTGMLPFIFIIVFQAVKLGENLFPAYRKFAIFITAIVLFECVLFAQTALVSPDIPVMAFFLYAFNSILKNKKVHLTIAILFLGILSMRAMMTATALYLFYIALHYPEFKQNKIKTIFSKMLPFIPGGLLSIAFFIYHYIAKGWIGFHSESIWADSFVPATTSGIFRNMLFLGWRIIDLGKIVTVVVCGILCLGWLTKKLKWENPDQRNRSGPLLFLMISLFVITGLTLCFYANLLAHRYMMPFYASIAILAIYLLAHLKVKHKNLIFALMILVQISGHFWTYPRRISQGWDSTLANLPYYHMREEFKSYIKAHNIQPQIVGSGFSMVGPEKYIDLNDEDAGFVDFTSDSLDYILYSNVTNTMNKASTFYFENWKIIKQEKRGHVEMVLFENPELTKTEK